MGSVMLIQQTTSQMNLARSLSLSGMFSISNCLFLNGRTVRLCSNGKKKYELFSPVLAVKSLRPAPLVTTTWAWCGGTTTYLGLKKTRTATTMIIGIANKKIGSIIFLLPPQVVWCLVASVGDTHYTRIDFSMRVPLTPSTISRLLPP